MIVRPLLLPLDQKWAFLHFCSLKEPQARAPSLGLEGKPCPEWGAGSAGHPHLCTETCGAWLVGRAEKGKLSP